MSYLLQCPCKSTNYSLFRIIPSGDKFLSRIESAGRCAAQQFGGHAHIYDDSAGQLSDGCQVYDIAARGFGYPVTPWQPSGKKSHESH